MRVAVTAITIIICGWAALGASSCSTSSSSSSGSDKSTDAGIRRQEQRDRAMDKYRTCQRQLGPLVRSESDLDGHLDIGLNFEDYGNRVGDVRAAYNQVPFKQLSFECVSSGVHAEKALNNYAKAAQIWSNCFDDVNCSTDSIKPQLQTQWSAAKRQIQNAQRQLDNIKRP